MINFSPITPPPELVQQWREESSTGELHFSPQYLATQAARWGADQELEACCAWLHKEINTGWCLDPQLRAARRPKPPSLKEQAQVELDRLVALISTEGALAMAEPIRRALEALPND